MLVNECLVIFNKSQDARGFQNTCVLFKVRQVIPNYSEGVFMGPLILKPLNNYLLIKRSLYSGANKAYFRSYLVKNILTYSAYIFILLFLKLSRIDTTPSF